MFADIKELEDYFTVPYKDIVKHLEEHYNASFRGYSQKVDKKTGRILGPLDFHFIKNKEGQ